MHHIQKKIVHTLTRKESARFAALRPKNLDGNIFTYHLKQLIAAKLVAKTEDGDYRLTQKGKLAGINIQLDFKDELEQAHSVLFLAAQNSKGEWLLRKRMVHPAYGKVGFLHCEPTANQSIFDTAEEVFEERTGLSAKFIVRGGGYVVLHREKELESFTHFTILQAKNVKGMPSSPGDSGQNFWHDGNLDDSDLFANMPKLIGLLQKSQELFFAEIREEI
jgi:predicted transcriptional regulator